MLQYSIFRNIASTHTPIRCSASCHCHRLPGSIFSSSNADFDFLFFTLFIIHCCDIHGSKHVFWSNLWYFSRLSSPWFSILGVQHPPPPPQPDWVHFLRPVRPVSPWAPLDEVFPWFDEIRYLASLHIMLLDQYILKPSSLCNFCKYLGSFWTNPIFKIPDCPRHLRKLKSQFKSNTQSWAN